MLILLGCDFSYSGSEDKKRLPGLLFFSTKVETIKNKVIIRIKKPYYYKVTFTA